MKTKVLAIIIAAILLVGAGTGIGFAIYANLPQNAAASAIFNAIEDFGKRDEIKPIIQVLEKGSLEFAVNKMEHEDEDLFEDSALSGKMYFSKDAFMLKNFELKSGSFNVSGDVYLSEDMLYLSENEILSNAYGVKFKDFADDFADSIFAYGSGSDYAITDQEQYDKIISALEVLNDDDMQKDAEKLVEKLYKKIWKIACDNFEFESEKDEVKIGGEREKVRVITVTIDGESLANAFSEFYEYLEDDDSIPKFLEKYGDALDIMFEANVVEDYDAYIEQMGDNLDDICDRIEDNYSEDIEIRVFTPRSAKRLVKLEVIVNEQDVFSLDIGMDGAKKSDEITFEVYGKEYTYQIKEDSSKEFECVLKDNTNTIKLSIDKKEDTFKLDIDTPNSANFTKLVLKGDWVTKFGKTTITVDKMQISSYGYDDNYNWGTLTETIDCEIVFVIDQSDKIPSAPKDYKRISDIADEDINGWQEKVEEIFFN